MANLGTKGDALEDYLTTPVVTTCTNPLLYWVLQLDVPDSKGKITVTAGGALAQMALDYLSVPGKLRFLFAVHSYSFGVIAATSIDIKHLFLHAGLVVTKHCFNLSDALTQAQVLLQSWWREDGLVDKAFLTKHFNTKHRHGKNANNND